MIALLPPAPALADLARRLASLGVDLACGETPGLSAEGLEHLLDLAEHAAWAG